MSQTLVCPSVCSHKVQEMGPFWHVCRQFYWWIEVTERIIAEGRGYKGVEVVYISGGDCDCDRSTHVCPAVDDGAVVIVSNTSVASIASIAWRWCNTCVNHLIYKCHSRLKLLSARNWTITVYITEWMSVSPSSVVIVSLWRILETIDDTRTPEWVLYSLPLPCPSPAKGSFPMKLF